MGRYKLWTQEEDDLLRELVANGKHSYRQMEQFFPGRGYTGLTSRARQVLNIFNDRYYQHKYTYDKAFFRVPDPLNSMIAGFLAADGSIVTPSTQAPLLRLEISVLDGQHLRMIKDALQYTGVINYGTKEQTTEYFQMTINEDYMDDLALNFGIIPRKTHHLAPPKLEGLANRVAFLAGLLDGDGCVHINKVGSLSVSYVSASITAVEWYKDIMTELKLPSMNRNTMTPSIRSLKHHGIACAYGLTYNGAKAVALVLTMQALKRDLGLPILDRKWDNPRLNQYIADFRARYPAFSYTPPDFRVSPPALAIAV